LRASRRSNGEGRHPHQLAAPDAVYDTGLWTPELLAARAKAYNLSVEQYRKKNLLRPKFRPRMSPSSPPKCAGRFSPRPRRPVPVDGGNERVV